MHEAFDEATRKDIQRITTSLKGEMGRWPTALGTEHVKFVAAVLGCRNHNPLVDVGMVAMAELSLLVQRLTKEVAALRQQLADRDAQIAVSTDIARTEQLQERLNVATEAIADRDAQITSLMQRIGQMNDAQGMANAVGYAIARSLQPPKKIKRKKKS